VDNPSSISPITARTRKTDSFGQPIGDRHVRAAPH
jgi:hypothetical protein